MSRFPPPPTWADVSDPAWLNWFLTISTSLSGVGATIAAGFTQALASSPYTVSSTVNTGDYHDDDLTITLSSTKRVLYWAEIGWSANVSTGSATPAFAPILERDGTRLRTGPTQFMYPTTSDPDNNNGSAVLLYAEDLAAGTYKIQLGITVTSSWASLGNGLVINPRVLLLYAP